jgi:hypothetical protein
MLGAFTIEAAVLAIGRGLLRKLWIDPSAPESFGTTRSDTVALVGGVVVPVGFVVEEIEDAVAAIA